MAKVANEDDEAACFFVDPHRDLLNALREKNISKFESILTSENVDIDKQFGPPDNGTLLDICCRQRETDEFVNALLKHGVNPNMINGASRRGPIHSVILQGDEQTLKTLLDYKETDVNLLDYTGSTALHLAVLNGKEEMVWLLLQRPDIDVNVINRKGLVPLHLAVDENNRKLVTLLLSVRKPLNLDVVNLDGVSLRDLIVQAFPDLSAKLSRSSDLGPIDATRLFSLLRSHQIDQFLRAARENEHLLESHDGSHTFLQYSCEYGLEDVVRALLDLNLNPNTTHSANEKTPVMIACGKGFVNIVEMLVRNKRTSFKPVNGDTVLHSLLKGSCEKGLGDADVERDHFKCMSLVLKLVSPDRLNINKRDFLGCTALHYAAKQREDDMVRLLLKSGAYIGVLNSAGEPACADISFETLESRLDDCLITNGKYPRDENYEVIFNYSNITPLKTDDFSMSTPSENMIHIGEEEEKEQHFNCESDPLVYLSKSTELRALLKHPIFTSYLYLKWHKIRNYFYVNLLVYMIFWGLFTGYILTTYSQAKSGPSNRTSIEYDDSSSSTFGDGLLWSLVTFFLALLFIRELFQLIISPVKYFCNPENWLEIGIICVAFIALFCSRCDTLSHQISAIAILMSWAELVLLIGKHPSLSTNIEMLKTVSWNFFKFLLWYSILIIAFALSFHSLFKDVSQDDNLFEDPGNSVFKTVVMLTGEFDTGSIPFIKYPVTSHVLFVLFVFLIAIVLFNLLNGLAVSDTQAIKSDAELVGYISQVKLISYVEHTLSNPATLLLLLSKLNGLCCCLPWKAWKPRRELFSNRVNMFMSPSDQQIRVLPNLANRVENDGGSFSRVKTTRQYDLEKRCSGGCSAVYMDSRIVRQARDILQRKSQESERQRQEEILLERERKLTEMLTECRETLRETKYLLSSLAKKT